MIFLTQNKCNFLFYSIKMQIRTISSTQGLGDSITGDSIFSVYHILRFQNHFLIIFQNNAFQITFHKAQNTMF